MLKRIIGLFAVAVLVFTVPTALSQMEKEQHVYTYVSQFQVPRAHWAAFAEDSEKTTVPIFQRLMADGTITGWGNFENIVHTQDGMTNGTWWTSPSLAGITRVLDELRKEGPRPGQVAATKHEDLLMRTVFSHTATASGAASGAGTGYLRVVCSLTQPGKADEFTAAIKKYVVPTVEDQIKKGNVTYYGMDQQYVVTGPGSMRCTVANFPNAEAMNKWADALNSTMDKMSPEDHKGWDAAIAATTVPDSRRDMLARITHSAHK
ncbi:MAG: hypothetical protein NVS9B13_14530 [Candidatus Acidiferrum sp.]